MESRITVIHVTESEEMSDKHYFDLTPLSSMYLIPLLVMYFQPQKPEQGLVS